MTNTKQLIKHLKGLSDPKAVEGMARYGIKPDRALGVSIPKLRKLARETGKDHALALDCGPPTDGRNYVKKTVNWALRQIGKRNIALNSLAVETAKELLALDSKAARWIATDALRELQGEAVQRRLARTD
jgi:3-methyladenine DNA glycosylase AlkD